MKIQFTPQIKLDSSYTKKEHINNKIAFQNHVYNPVAYQDYNISFGKRLFRTPENFYEQDFNEKGMPRLLHEYIYEGSDSAFRRTIPPAQAMKEVYGNIKFAENLDMVKQIYPNEPLFVDLHSKPSKNAREGVLSELMLMRSDVSYQDKSLFKNGKDDLGLYVLKKIYVEGKTLKEINKDFHKDISVVYKGLGDIKYSDLRAFGIHYPNSGFWKSFVATREDFPYVYIPRKVEDIQKSASVIEKRHSSGAYATRAQGKKFENVKDWELDKITRTVEETNGGISDIQKKIRKNGNTDSSNFVAKYMSEIMSVTLDRLHASPEMKSFFEDYEYLSVSQRAILKKYWANPDTKLNMSLVMKSTIQAFMDAYGVDGENEEFKDLLDYARQIKPERLKEEKHHEEIQKEYDEMFRLLDMEQEESIEDVKTDTEVVEEKEEIDNFQARLQKSAQQNNAKIYQFILSNGSSISIVANLREMLKDKVDRELSFYPRSYRQHFTDYVMNNYGQDPKYLLSMFYNVENIGDVYNILAENDGGETALSDNEKEMLVKEHFMSRDEINAMTVKIRDEYQQKYSIRYNAVKEVLYELLMTHPIDQSTIEKFVDFKEEEFIKLGLYPDMTPGERRYQAKHEIQLVIDRFREPRAITLTAGDMNDGLELAGLKFKDLESEINQKYNLYSSKLSETERRKISQSIVGTFLNYQEKNSLLSDERSRKIFTAIKENIRNPRVRSALVDTLVRADVVGPDRGDMRVFLQKNANKSVLMAKAELFMMDFINKDMSGLAPLLAIDRNVLERVIKPVDEDLYKTLMFFRLQNGVFR